MKSQRFQNRFKHHRTQAKYIHQNIQNGKTLFSSGLEEKKTDQYKRLCVEV